MHIEKLNENKIRITLNLDDLKENNIDLHSFMASSIESQDFFYDMLDKAENEVGFETRDYKLMIEALAIPNGNFILTVTRFSSEKEKIKKPIAKRKTFNEKTNISVYEFESFDNFVEFCSYLRTNIDGPTYVKLKKSTLYSYSNKYYLVINLNSFKIDIFKTLHCSIIEFGKFISNSDLFERKLVEYGKVIYKTNAIGKCTNVFLNKD